MSSSSLKYGHIVRIKPNDSNIVSYITSKSYTDPNLYFQTYGFQEVLEKADISNYRESLFQILPTSSFEINDEMNSFKSQAKKAETAPRAKTEEEQFRTMIDEKKGNSIFFGDKVVFKHLDSKHYMYGSFDCARSGIGAFSIDLRKQLSEKLVFQLFSYRTYEKDGDQISLDAPLKIYHFETQCYLSYEPEPIFLDRDSAKLAAQDREVYDEYNMWCPQPQLRLFNAVKSEQAEYLYEQEEQKSKTVKERITDVCRYEIINQNIAKRIWKFELYLDVQAKPNKQIIRNHDIVYLLHTKDDKYLAPDNFQENVFLKKRLDVSDPDFIFDGLWEIQQNSQAALNDGEIALRNRYSAGNKNKLGASFFPLMSINLNSSIRKQTMMGVSAQAIKKEQKNKGKQEKIVYTLRHLISGRVLYYSESLKDKSKIGPLLVHPNDETYKQNDNQKYGIVLLQCLQSKLVDGALTRLSLANGKKNFEVKSQKKHELAILSKQEEHIMNEEEEEKEKFERLLDQKEDEVQQTYQSNFEKEQLEAVKDASEHGFRIYKIDESIKEIALMVMSSQQIIYKFIKFLKYFNPESPTDIRSFNMTILNTVINVLKSLIGFIYDCDYTKIVSSGNSPIALRQRVFDEIGMVELITILIDEIKNNDERLDEVSKKLNKLSEYRKVRTIYSLGYEILESVAASNPLLKIKISKYLQIYLQHILLPQNRVVYRSIQEILDGNELALQKKVEQIYISSLIKTFINSNTVTDPADLQFLSTLCLCKNRTVQKNQNAVFTNFYENNDSEDNKFFFKQDHGKYQIQSKITKKQNSRLRTLPELFLQCEMSQMDGVVDPSKGHWNYFIQYLNLLADVCVHRNIAPLQYIAENLPLKTLQEFLQQKLVKNKLLHQPFIRLVHHAFVEHENFKQISRITKVKKWNNLGDFSIPKSKHPVNAEISSILNIVVQYIKKINLKPWKEKNEKGNPDEQPESIEFDPEDMVALKNVNTFLQILQSTMVLGFWPSMEQLKKLVPYVLKILSFDIEYAKKIAKNPDVISSIVHISQADLQMKVYRKVKQELRLNKSNITLLVQCKLLAAKILNIIIDYEFNIRVSMVTKHFKDVQEQEVDLKNYPYNQFEFKKKWKEDKEYAIFKPDNEKEGYLMNERLWIDKINEIIQAGNVFEYCGNPNATTEEEGKGLYGEGIDWMLALFEAFIYGDKELTDIVLSILIRTTNERKKLLETFKDIILVAGGNLNKLTDRVLVTRNALLKLSTQQVLTENFAKGNLWKKLSSGGPSSEGNVPGTIQELAFLTISMKKNEVQTLSRACKLYTMTDLYPFKNFGGLVEGDEMELFGAEMKKDRSYLIITEKDENNPLNQNLIKSQDHHTLIRSFIKIMQTTQKDDFPLMALHAAYNFLTVLVWNNIEIKNELDPFLSEAEQHINKNVGCIDFIHEMYKNNSKLVLKIDVSRIVNKIIDQANKQDITFYHKSKLLDFLRTICVFDNKGIEKNQNIVMEIISQYQVSDNNQIVYLQVEDGISKTISDRFEGWMGNYRVSHENTIQNYADLDVSAELFYVATFFEIFSCLIENQNKVNIGKCTNMHPHEFLIKMIRKFRPCWPILRHLRAYINNLYYFSREPDSTIFKEFVEKQIENIHEELKDLVTLIVTCPDYHLIRITNPIRYSYLGSYIFLCLEECLNSLHLMFSNKEFARFLSMNYLSQKKQTSTPYYYKFFQMIEMLQHLMKVMDGRYINKYLSSVSAHLKKAVSECPQDIAEDYNQKVRSEIADNLAQKKLSAEDVPLKKNYIFHENKGFWRHLVDWNSTFDQNQARQSVRDAIQKKNDISGNTESDNKKRRELLLEKIFYTINIEKKLLKRDPKPRSAFITSEKQEKEDSGNTEEKVEDGADSQLPKNLVTSQSQRFKVKNERFPNAQTKNATINTRRKKLVKFIQVSPELSKYAEEEVRDKLYQGFASLTDSSIKKYQIEVVGRQDVIKTIVDMNRKDPKSIQLEFKVEILKMLTSFIQKESPVFQQEIETWKLTKTNEIQGLANAQNFLNECDCAQFLCSLFENDLNESIKMSNEIIMFGICLLFNKNENVQNSILKILKKDEKNVILTQLQGLIKQNSNSIAFYTPYKAQLKFPIPANYSDTYDFFVTTQKIMERKFTYIPETVLEQKEFEQKMTFLQRIFIFLKVLCEGNNQQIKNFIRDQAEGQEDRGINVESINFISLSASELKKLFLNFRMQILKVPFAIVDFLNEVTRFPCIRNQLFLCKQTTYFLDFSSLQKSIGSNKISSQNDKLRISEFFAENIMTCLSCLQGNHEQIRKSLISGDLPEYYARIFNFFNTILASDKDWGYYSVQQLESKMSNTPAYQGKILRLFDITTVIKKLSLKFPKFKDEVDHNFDKIIKENNEYEEIKLFFALFETHMLGIEINIDKTPANNEQRQIEYFPYHPVFRYLSRTTRSIIMEEIDRNTQRDKIIGLINTTEQITEEINYNFDLDHAYHIKNIPIEISASKISKFQSIGLIFAVSISILLTILSTVIYYPDDEDIEYDLGGYFLFIYVLSVLEFSFASLYVGLWYINHFKLALSKYELTKKAIEKKQGKIEEPGPLEKIMFKIPGFKILYCLTLYDKEFPGIALFIFGSFMGTFYKPEWFSLLIMIIMMKKMSVLKNMVDSITSKIDILLMLSLLGTSFIAIFSIFSLTFYVKSLYEEETPNQHCETVFSCIKELYVQGQINSEVESFESGRFLFDMIYMIFMDILFNAIIGGILTDTFSELAEKHDAIEDDKVNNCFICGITQQVLEKKNSDIQKHYKTGNHKLWNYVFYIYNLNLKTQKKGLDYIIDNKISLEDVTWVPVESGDEDDIGTRIEALTNAIQSQKEFIEKLQLSES